MCRLLAYRGASILLDKLLYQPKNSLIHQSYDAQEIEEPLNGDGFGIGWYVPDIDPDPAVFVSVFPAWNNRNLRFLAPRIETNCFFAHVRAASIGDISEANCHPFTYKRFLFMHNGNIDGFERMKREVRSRLSDEMYQWIKGQTDSEHFFALLADKFVKAKKKTPTLKDIVAAFRATIAEIADIRKTLKIKGDTYLNMVITDGERIVASRYISNPKEKPLSLYYSTGNRYECHGGVCRMIEARDAERSVLVVSERLTAEKSEWHEIPRNHFVAIDTDLKVKLESI